MKEIHAIGVFLFVRLGARLILDHKESREDFVKDTVGLMLREAWQKNGKTECLHPELSAERSFSGVVTGFNICTTCGQLLHSHMQEKPSPAHPPSASLVHAQIMNPMDNRQLEALALKVWHQGNGMYRGKALCRVCVLVKASITASEDTQRFEHIWDHWGTRLKRDRCVVCGELKETMTVSG